MGIQGLIPFLEKTSRPVNIKEFAGSTAAIDAYCWLHKGVFVCADRLAVDDTCDAYVHYCMKFVNTLLAHDIKPILVFDGQKLPAKAGTEKKRKELREQNRRKAAELMRCDRGKEAQTYLRQSIDVTHVMALNLIRVCRARNVDCIVAPYEADAQLAYLSIHDVARIIITEDSDLLLFGAKKVLFKMDVNGNGLLVEQEKLHVSMGVQQDAFSFEKFRFMCILSGCDYLSSLPGIGLAKACRFISRTVDPDIYRAISRLGSHLNMPQIKVTDEYKRSFMEADFMFKHQPVFDPFTRRLVPLTPISSAHDDDVQRFRDLLAVNGLSDEQARQLAYGNLEPFTLSALDNWTPPAKSNEKRCGSDRVQQNWRTSHSSIWDVDYVPHAPTNQSHHAPSIAFKGYLRKVSRTTNSTSTTTPPLPKTTKNGDDQLRQLKLIYANTTATTENDDEDVAKSKHCHHSQTDNDAPLVVSRYFFGGYSKDTTAVNGGVNETSVMGRSDNANAETENAPPTRSPHHRMSEDNANASPEFIPKKANPFAVRKRRLEFSLTTTTTTTSSSNSNNTDDHNIETVKTSHKAATTISTTATTSSFKWTHFSPSNPSTVNDHDSAKKMKFLRSPLMTSSVTNIESRKFGWRPATLSKCRTTGLAKRTASEPKLTSLLKMFAFKKPEKLKV